jgi:hypothetical protein
MLELAALQNVVVEHKKALANAIGAELTKQVQSLGLSDATVWISFAEGAKELATARARTAKRRQAKAADSKTEKLSPKVKADKKAFYMCNYWRKKKGLTPLTMDAWKAEKSGKPAAKESPEKNG